VIPAQGPKKPTIEEAKIADVVDEDDWLHGNFEVEDEDWNGVDITSNEAGGDNFVELDFDTSFMTNAMTAGA